MSGNEVPMPMLPQPMEVRRPIAAALRSEADALEREGHPPSVALIQSLIDFLHTEEAITEEMKRQAAEAEQHRKAAEEEAERLRIERAEQTEQVRKKLQSFQSIQCADINLELEYQQQLAAKLEQRLPLNDNDPDEHTFHELLSGEHPWMKLLRLVKEGDGLGDDEWEHLNERVRSSFESSLANAVLRGRLSHSATGSIDNAKPPVVNEPAVLNDVDDSTPDETDQAESTSQKVSEQNIPPLPQIEDDTVEVSGSVFDELTESAGRNDVDLLKRSGVIIPSIRESNEPEIIHNALFENSSGRASGDSSILRQQHRFNDPVGACGELATEILSVNQSRRDELLPELVQALIFEGRSGLAFHLARCMETVHPPIPQVFPAWSIRAWTIGNAVLFPSGQLAARLQEDFSQFNAKTLQALPSEQALAIGLFVRAAALRPAVVAPSSRAAHVLRSFEMNTESSQLYNYCMRIGSYGEKLQGISPTSFKRAHSEDAGGESLQQLRDDIQFWLNDTSSNGVAYSLTNPLFTRAHWSLRNSTTRRYAAEVQIWQQWQDTLQTSHRIIQNVLRDRREAITETRHEIDRLALLTTGDRSPLSLQSNEEMRNYLLQAITFGQRWISLHSTSKIEAFVPDDFNELRTEIERRHESVVEELRELADRHPQPEVQLALGCLLLAMDQLRDLVNPDVATESQEPDARHLIHSELLKVPGLQFSSNWQPDADPDTLLDIILRYLADPNPDWITAVQLQLGQDNLDAAEKISTLPVWNRTEQAQLQTVLTRYRKQLRNQLWQDLQETEALIDEAARLQIFNEQDRAGFSARLERLRRGLSLSRHHSGDVLEITQLRNAVEKRRAREASRTYERLEKPETHGGTSPPPRKGWKMDF